MRDCTYEGAYLCMALVKHHGAIFVDSSVWTGQALQGHSVLFYKGIAAAGDVILLIVRIYLMTAISKTT